MGGGHVRGFLQLPNARVTAICDVKQEIRQQFKEMVDTKYGGKDCLAYTDFRELLERKDIDAIMLAPGERWTPIMGAEAARRGMHLYYEKPLSLTVAEGKVIREVVRRTGVIFQFGTLQRSNLYFQTAVALTHAGKIGQLQKVVISSAEDQSIALEQPRPAPPTIDWDLWLGPAPWVPYSDRRVSLSWLGIYDYGLGHVGGGYAIHDLDIAQWANQSDHAAPVSVEGKGTFYQDIRDTLSTYEVEYVYANGVKVHLLNATAAKERYPQIPVESGSASVLILGTEGWIWVSRRGMISHPESIVRTTLRRVGTIGITEHRRDFIESIRTGKPTAAPIEVAFNNEVMSQMADLSVRMKRKLRWDPVKEEFIDDAQANRRLSRPMRSPWRIEVPESLGKMPASARKA